MPIFEDAHNQHTFALTAKFGFGKTGTCNSLGSDTLMVPFMSRKSGGYNPHYIQEGADYCG